MANRRRGEVDVVLDGQTYQMCLPLGALAELEAAFEEDDMLGLVGRFGNGQLKSEDAIRVIGAGLRGAGHQLSNEDVAGMRCETGAAGFVTAVVELLQATFGSSDDAAGKANVSHGSSAAPKEERSPAPFPGMTSRTLHSVY